MGQSIQRTETKKLNIMFRPIQEMYKKNLEALIALKADLIAHNVEWDTIAPETDGLDELKLKQKAERSQSERLYRMEESCDRL
jgi:hypothetical protein